MNSHFGLWNVALKIIRFKKKNKPNLGLTSNLFCDRLFSRVWGVLRVGLGHAAAFGHAKGSLVCLHHRVSCFPFILKVFFRRPGHPDHPGGAQWAGPAAGPSVLLRTVSRGQLRCWAEQAGPRPPEGGLLFLGPRLTWMLRYIYVTDDLLFQ